jgi:hypothetical protein
MVWVVFHVNVRQEQREELATFVWILNKQKIKLFAAQPGKNIF